MGLQSTLDRPGRTLLCVEHRGHAALVDVTTAITVTHKCALLLCDAEERGIVGWTLGRDQHSVIGRKLSLGLPRNFSGRLRVLYVPSHFAADVAKVCQSVLLVWSDLKLVDDKQVVVAFSRQLHRLRQVPPGLDVKISQLIQMVVDFGASGPM